MERVFVNENAALYISANLQERCNALWTINEVAGVYIESAVVDLESNKILAKPKESQKKKKCLIL